MKKPNLILIAKTIKGTSFVGIRNYENASGEVSNQTILVGISWENVLKSDLATLESKKEEVIATLTKDHDKTLVEQAFKNVLDSLIKRTATEEQKELLRKLDDKTIAQSDAQIDAYVTLATGVQYNYNTGKIYVKGMGVRKEVLVKGEFKETKSRELTIVQNKIQRLCEFKQLKYKNFVLDKAEVQMQGVTF